MLVIRIAKICCIAALTVYAALVAFGNLTDYGTNFAFVTHVLDMDAIPAGSAVQWRAVASPTLHQVAYALIIATEILTAALTGLGALAMLRQLSAKAQAFQAAKGAAVAGLTLGFLLFEGGFIAVGGEWFSMWRSHDWDGVPSAFRIAVTMLGVLIFISLKDEDLT
jgi:predicted small integral membrane protein